MITTYQRTLPLLVPANTTLLGLQAVRAILGVDTDSVVSLIDEGELAWCFDLCARGQTDRRDLRVWVECVICRRHDKAQPDGPALEILQEITGYHASQWISAHNLAVRFNVTRPTVMRWCKRGDLDSELVGHERRVRRASVPTFLARRMVGAQ
jgi:excisionase family DNA binding protein